MIDWLLVNGWVLWLALFLILATVEMLTLDLFFIMMSVGALAALGSFFTGIPLWAQVIVFAVVSLLMIVLVRPIALRHLRKGPKDQRTNIDRLIGNSATVMEEVTESGGLIKICGDVWSARSRGGDMFEAGAKVTVAHIDGATAIVRFADPLPTLAVTDSIPISQPNPSARGNAAL